MPEFNTPRKVRRTQTASTPTAPGQGSGRPIFAPRDTGGPKTPFAWRKLLQRTGIVVGAGVVLWAIFLSGWFTVRGIEVRNSSTVTNQDLSKLFATYTAGNQLQKNIFFINTTGLAELFQQQYPTLEKVNINRTLFLTLSVTVKESASALVWQSGTGAWILGDDGKILKKDDGQGRQLGSVRDTAQLMVKVGDQVADRQFVRFVRDIYAQAKAYDLAITSAEISTTTRELTLKLGSGQTIRMDTSREARGQLDAVRATYETAKRTNKPVTQYIDVRVPGRTFYK